MHERRLVRRRLAEPVGDADAGYGALQRGLVGGVDAGERGVGLDGRAEADQGLKADRMVDGVANARREPTCLIWLVYAI